MYPPRGPLTPISLGWAIYILKSDAFPRIFDGAEQQFGYLDTNNDSFITVEDLLEGVSMAYDHTTLPIFSGLLVGI